MYTVGEQNYIKIGWQGIIRGIREGYWFAGII
jgi:hypothetical protein